MLSCSYLITLVISNNELNFLCEIPHFEPHLETDVQAATLQKITTQLVHDVDHARI